ncbi:hypothetical protein QTO34_000332 [Cnephaeus nilssonii]|uniref:Uncharacterized protein n=1 Tax=Cnephaeus nilssonii TaxID=3371016 RepID=A0AA40IC29_CNENI|nr:hypothetical protein QTO34_000332 [Eptesicus nilssonii]
MLTTTEAVAPLVKATKQSQESESDETSPESPEPPEPVKEKEKEKEKKTKKKEKKAKAAAEIRIFKDNTLFKAKIMSMYYGIYNTGGSKMCKKCAENWSKEQLPHAACTYLMSSSWVSGQTQSEEQQPHVQLTPA